MKLPFTFKEFVTKPFAAIAIILILAVGYLYVDSRKSNAEVIEACRESQKVKDERITKLENDVKDLYDKIIELSHIKKTNP